MNKDDWKEGTVQEFLDLSDSDMALVETKVALARAFRRQRITSHLTQMDMARAMRTTKTRVARIEAGDPNIPLDLVFKALYTVGFTPFDIGGVMRETDAVYSE